jgi:hypothetical protein
MSDSSQTAVRERDSRGHFAPGVSGNPAGKKKGTRNRATRLDEMLGEGTNAAVLEKAVEVAMEGDVRLLNRFVDRTLPKPRGETIRLALPEGTQPGDPGALHNAAYIALANSEITIEQAVGVCKFIEFREVALDGYDKKRDLERYGDKIPAEEAFRGYEWPKADEKESCQFSAVSSQPDVPEAAPASEISPASDLQIQAEAAPAGKTGNPRAKRRQRSEPGSAHSSAVSSAPDAKGREAEADGQQLLPPASTLQIQAASPDTNRQERKASGQQVADPPLPAQSILPPAFALIWLVFCQEGF